MFIKMLKKDFKRKKVITIVLFVFMLLAATLAAGGTRMFLSLTGSMDNLFTKANTAHYVQCHIGTYDEMYVQQWASETPYIKEWSVQKLLKPTDVSVYVNGSNTKIDLGISEIGFIMQNNEIDILLNLENQKLSVSDGYIAVPIFFMQQENLKIGDTLIIKYTGYEKSFIISDFIRDSQYGKVMMTAKRFVLSERDYKEMEYVGTDAADTFFCFVLKDESMLRDFTRVFQASNMPQNDYSVDISLFRLAYGSTDSIIIGLVLLCSILLVFVAFLTLRYTILSTIEEDFREIGVMKAIGFKFSDIIKLYMSKYLYLTSTACTLGFLLGQPLSRAMSSELLLYLGTSDNGMAGILLSFGSVALIFILILSFCLLTLRRIGKMTAIDAIRMGNIGETYRDSKLFSLAQHHYLNVNIFIGLKDIFNKLKNYILLFFVFWVCSFICILPINVKNTFAASDFINYFGFKTSDIAATSGIINGESNIDAFISVLKSDYDVLKWELYMERYCKVKTEDGQTQKLRTTVGNHAAFELKYSSGTPPVLPNEIALSYLASKDLGKGVGDSVLLELDGIDRYMLVSGIYQDMSNGGRAILACFESDYKDAFNWNINFNVSGNSEEKAREYQKLFKDVTVTTIENTSDSFTGEYVEQLKNVSMLISVIALLISVLITALFIKMLTVKEASQIGIMKSMGFTRRHIRTQYFTRIGSILFIGIVSGTVSANILGEKIMNIVTETLGASGTKFNIMPMEVYLIYPLALLAAVCVTVMLSSYTIRKISISQINAE